MMATKVENPTEAAARLAERIEIIDPEKKRKLSDSGRTARLKRNHMMILQAHAFILELGVVTNDRWPSLTNYLCLALCLLYGLENIGSLYSSMSMIVIGHSLLY
jgi:hypothetical protein